MLFFPNRDNPTDVKIIHQAVDSLESNHISLDEDYYNKEYDDLLDYLEDYKLQAQSVETLDQKSRFVKIEDVIGFGSFKIYAQGTGAYAYMLENSDITIKIGKIQYGANDFKIPQIKVQYRAHYLFAIGHQQAYTNALRFVNKALGSTRNTIGRIDLATDVQGVKYTPFDIFRFQHNYTTKNFMTASQFLRHHRVTGFQFGSGDFVFRIYDKVEEIKKKAQKAFVKSKWIMNGYDDTVDKPLSVWRHEVQYRSKELKKYMPKDLEDEIIYTFNQLDKLWNKGINKVRWTDLSNEELNRMDTKDLKTDSIKKIFQRARANPTRLDFWHILSNWENNPTTQAIDYIKINEPKKEIAKRQFKGLISSAMKYSGGNPNSVLDVITEVTNELKQFENLTLFDYGMLKVLSNFVQNSKEIDKHSLNPIYDYKYSANNIYQFLLTELKTPTSYEPMTQAQLYLTKESA